LKKILAILLLVVHLFNVSGYRLFFSFAESFADKQIVASIDANKYDETALVQIKMPLNIPYSIDHRSYERCNGQIEINGVQYNYVKRIVQNDTLYLYCVPNESKTQLCNTKADYTKQLADVPSNKKAGSPDIKLNVFSGDYNIISPDHNFYVDLHMNARSGLFNNNSTLPGFTTAPSQPPDIV